MVIGNLEIQPKWPSNRNRDSLVIVIDPALVPIAGQVEVCHVHILERNSIGLLKIILKIFLKFIFKNMFLTFAILLKF